VTVPTPQELTKALEAALEAGRDKWPTGLCRRLWDFLSEVAENRRRSPQHTTRWFHLVGFCLRPVSAILDKFRVEQLWKMMHAVRKDPASGRPLPPQPDGGADAWIMWRGSRAG